MAGSSKTTQDHETIKQWAEERNATPSVVKDTQGDGKGIGVLRFDFEEEGQGPEDSLRPISWDEFFETFDKKNLVFLYQDTVRSGETSRFFKFIAGDND